MTMVMSWVTAGPWCTRRLYSRKVSWLLKPMYSTWEAIIFFSPLGPGRTPARGAVAAAARGAGTSGTMGITGACAVGAWTGPADGVEAGFDESRFSSMRPAAWTADLMGCLFLVRRLTSNRDLTSFLLHALAAYGAPAAA